MKTAVGVCTVTAVYVQYRTPEHEPSTKINIKPGTAAAAAALAYEV